jgi:hypothetical protein
MVGSRENGTEPPGSTDGRKCIDYLNDYKLVKGSAPWSYLYIKIDMTHVVSSARLQPKSDWSGKAQKQFYSKLQTCPLVREGATK